MLSENLKSMGHELYSISEFDINKDNSTGIHEVMNAPQFTLSNSFVVQLPFSLFGCFLSCYFHFVNNVLLCSLFIIDLPFAIVYFVSNLYFTCMHLYGESCSQ